MADAFRAPLLMSAAVAASAAANASDAAGSNPNTSTNTTTASWREALPPRVPQHSYSYVPQQRQQQQQPPATFTFTFTKDSVCYVGIHLKRPPMQKSWGLALSMLEGMIVLGDVNLNGNLNPLPCIMNTSTSTCTQWCHVLACQNQAQVDQHYHHLQYLNQKGLLWYFGQQLAASPQTTTTTTTNVNDVEPHLRQLCPGDLLVAIDGFSARNFGSLQGCTDYLKYSDEVTLVVLRHSRAQEAARNIIWRNNAKNSGNSNPNPQAPLQAALAALPLWKEYFYNKNISNNPNNHMPITRQVTPDHPSMMARPSSESCDPSPQLQALHLLSSLASRITTETTPHLSVPMQSPNSCAIPSSRQPFVVSKKRKYCPKPPNKLKSSSPLFVLPDAPWKNPWFRQENGECIPFCDNWEFSPEEGSRSSLFLPPMNRNSSQFQTWLQQRKATWRTKYRVTKHPSSDVRKYYPTPSNKLKSSSSPLLFVLPDSWRNPWFRQENGESIPFCDNWEFSPEEGSRSSLFLPPMNRDSSEFQTWLQQRKAMWRTKYRVSKHPSDVQDERDTSDEVDQESVVVAKDFWRASQGFGSWEEWLAQSVARWKFGYSWNRAKRQRIQQECEEVVHVTTHNNGLNFDHWLHIRKKQWVVLRRKRQRKQKEEEQVEAEAKFKEREVVEPTQSPKVASTADASSAMTKTSLESPAAPILATIPRRNLRQSVACNDLVFIDDMLEQEERRHKALLERPPLDISFLFDANKGAPDDVVVHCLLFLSPSEHTKLLCISYTTALALKARNEVWRQLCPNRWVLPRRPRKPWHELYRSMLSRELRDSRKLWDDLLIKSATVLLKGDHLQKIEKLVQTGTAGFGFEVNYISPVVCERNSLLNMAVIHQRHKIVRWLVDEKRAELESYDRGQFTPLLNAAWSGDKYLVRFFLQRGSDRTKVGTGHSSAGLAAPHFKGLTAEGWARKKGHEDIANLIRVGL